MMTNEGCVQAGVLKVFGKTFQPVILMQEMQNEIHVFEPCCAFPEEIPVQV
jgi:hypothetical protein